MIDVTFPGTTATVTAAEPDGAATRTIAGTAVPWDAVGTVADGTRVMFRPGSLDAAELPIVLRGHDGPPIGRTASNTATDAGMSTTVRVSRVRDGDEALVLAEDGVLAMFSVGVNPTEWHYDDDGVMVVEAGDWHHTALLPFGAFSAARVTDVAASQPQPTTGETMTDTLDTAADVAPGTIVTTTDPGAAAVEASRPAVIPVHGATVEAEAMTLNRVSRIIGAGMESKVGAAAIRAQINAALTNVVTTGVPSHTRPAYQAELLPLINHGNPTAQALTQKPLPASGMKIEYPQWLAPPVSTAIQATEKSAIASTAVTTEVKSVDVKTYAQGNDISMQVMDRSDPSFIEAYLAAAAAHAGRKWDQDVITALLAAATAGTPGASFVANVAALYNALNPATCPPGPLFLAVSKDVMANMIPVVGLNGPAFWSATIDLSEYLPSGSAGGLNMFCDWNMPAQTALMGVSTAAAVYGGPSTFADVRVVDVSLLGVDVGVYFYAALAIYYPGGFSKLSGITTLEADTSTTSKSK